MSCGSAGRQGDGGSSSVQQVLAFIALSGTAFLPSHGGTVALAHKGDIYSSAILLITNHTEWCFQLVVMFSGRVQNYVYGGLQKLNVLGTVTTGNAICVPCHPFEGRCQINLEVEEMLTGLTGRSPTFSGCFRKIP